MRKQAKRHTRRTRKEMRHERRPIRDKRTQEQIRTRALPCRSHNLSRYTGGGHVGAHAKILAAIQVCRVDN